jgi:hypothetical protein
MLKNLSKYERENSVRPNSTFLSPASSALLLYHSAGNCQRVLVNESGVSPDNIIPPWFSMLIYHLKDGQ